MSKFADALDILNDAFDATEEGLPLARTTLLNVLTVLGRSHGTLASDEHADALLNLLAPAPDSAQMAQATEIIATTYEYSYAGSRSVLHDVLKALKGTPANLD